MIVVSLTAKDIISAQIIHEVIVKEVSSYPRIKLV